MSKRDDNVCNFLEGGTLIGGSDCKLIYRHYATLYFVFCVDSSESELGILDLIQVFVETLDRRFENVCELDLIFHVEQVHHILNEIVMGGMVLETNMNEILTRIKEQDELEKKEVSFEPILLLKIVCFLVGNCCGTCQSSFCRQKYEHSTTNQRSQITRFAIIQQFQKSFLIFEINKKNCRNFINNFQFAFHIILV